MEKLPVIATIPTYNMGNEVVSAIDDVIQQDFDAVYVLDDHSNDGTPDMLRKRYGDSITVVEGRENLGAGGNRNRIIEALAKVGSSQDAILCFIDADVRIESNNPPFAKTARELVKKYPSAGVIGGLVLNADGSRGVYNYGPELSLRYVAAQVYLAYLEGQTRANADKAAMLRNKHSALLAGYPNTFEEPKATSVDWLVENFTFIPYKVFAEVGGYEASLHYCEAVDFGMRLKKLGLDRVFDPTLTVRHTQVDHRGMKRYLEVLDATVKLTAYKIAGRY